VERRAPIPVGQDFSPAHERRACDTVNQMTLRLALLIAVLLFPVSEIALGVLKHASRETARDEDRGSMRLLWQAIGLGVALAIAAQWSPFGRMHIRPQVLNLAGLVLVVGGLSVRWIAILTLGRLFTVNVAIHADHHVVQTGLYRYVRHPSYSGLLLAFLGLGLFYGSWLSLVLLMTPISLAVVNRVVKEERALLTALGEPYAEYCARTKRLVPFVV
jgi:protein-S-isoprenylcysteine O-methyltransferase